MRLVYAEPGRRAVVMEHRLDGRRIELSLHDQRDGKTFSLVALSGTLAQGVSKHRCMGPFHSMAQGRGAISGLVAALQSEGFMSSDVPRCWEMIAAKLARDIRELRNANEIDCTFVPLGLPPDKL